MFSIFTFKREPPAGAVLIDLRRDGRMIVFTFQNGEMIFTISAVGTWGDDIETWKRLAGLT